MAFADHFSTIANTYATYRPRYPAELSAALAALCEQRDVAWDCGCGNGQFSVALAARFGNVIATDPAQAQLDAAERCDNIDYRCTAAEASGLDASSVDLAVAAQAAHWFDWPRYVAEVERVARPGALVALVSYGNFEVPGEVGSVLARYYRDDVGPYWPAGRQHVENGYRDLAWPWPAVPAPAIAMRATWTRDELVGYVASWSATAKMIEAKGPGAFETLRTKLATSWPDAEKREIRWPLAIRLARR
jgi:SAM-dependent methyltransferase